MKQREDRPLVAFLGPSLPAAEARRLAPEVELLPPVCQGDLSTVVERANPRGVLIVDGEFGQSLSVWHSPTRGRRAGQPLGGEEPGTEKILTSEVERPEEILSLQGPARRWCK